MCVQGVCVQGVCVQGVSGGIVNILGGGSMDISQFKPVSAC